MDSSAGESLAQLARALHCALCGGFFEDPVSLPCAHVFCSACIRGALSGLGVVKNECPSCSQPAFVRDLSKNTKIAAVTELLRGLADASPQPCTAECAAGAGGGRPRASPAAAVSPLPSGSVPSARLRSDKCSSDAAASPQPSAALEEAGRVSASASRDEPPAVGALAAWAARQRALATPTSSECVALAHDADAIRAALAAVDSKLQGLPACGAAGADDRGGRGGGGAGGLPACGAAGAEDTGGGGGSSGGGGAAGGAGDSDDGDAPCDESEPAISHRADAEARPSFAGYSTQELKRMCRAAFGAVYDVKKMRRKLAALDPEWLAAALAAHEADAAPACAADAAPPNAEEETPADAADAEDAE
jgi:hypothetical protein